MTQPPTLRVITQDCSAEDEPHLSFVVSNENMLYPEKVRHIIQEIIETIQESTDIISGYFVHFREQPSLLALDDCVCVQFTHGIFPDGGTPLCVEYVDPNDVEVNLEQAYKKWINQPTDISYTQEKSASTPQTSFN